MKDIYIFIYEKTYKLECNTYHFNQNFMLILLFDIIDFL